MLTHYRAGWTDVKDYTGKVHYPGKLIADEDLKHLKGELYDKFSYWNKVEFNKEVIEKHFKEVVDFAVYINSRCIVVNLVVSPQPQKPIKNVGIKI